MNIYKCCSYEWHRFCTSRSKSCSLVLRIVATQMDSFLQFDCTEHNLRLTIHSLRTPNNDGEFGTFRLLLLTMEEWCMPVYETKPYNMLVFLTQNHWSSWWVWLTSDSLEPHPPDDWGGCGLQVIHWSHTHLTTEVGVAYKWFTGATPTWQSQSQVSWTG